MTEVTTAPWREEWRAYRVRCTPAFSGIADEAAFFEDLQYIGAWYLVEGEDLIVCVERDGPNVRRDAALAALRRQGVEPIVEEEGRGFALRGDALVLREYRIEIGSTRYQKEVGRR